MIQGLVGVPHSNADVELLRVLSKRENFAKYNHLIRPYTLLPEAAQLIEDIGEWYAANPMADAVEWPGFLAWMRTTRHPQWRPTQHSQFEAIVNNIASSTDARPEVIDRFVELDYATQARDIIDKVISGTAAGGLTPLDPILTEYRELVRAMSAPSVVAADLEAVLNAVVRAGTGVEWRLEDMNRSVGPLRKGDFVMIGKRPEVGGTSFVCSEITHMVTQLPGNLNAILFNNEEVGNKLQLRLYQTALGASAWDLQADPKLHEANYQKALAGRRVDVYHKTGLTTEDVERALRGGEYGLIAFNTLAKVQGFNKLEGPDRLQALGIWARNIADRYGVVLGVHQADNSAEGQKWLDQSQLYGSKTGLQGESDVQLMIGRSHDPHEQNRRFISVVRNKTPGGPRTEADKRHGRFEVGFDDATGRFSTLSFTPGKTP